MHSSSNRSYRTSSIRRLEEAKEAPEMRLASSAKGHMGRRYVLQVQPLAYVRSITNALYMPFPIRPWGRDGDGESKRIHRYIWLKELVAINVVILSGNFWSNHIQNIQSQVAGNNVVIWDASVVDSPVVPAQVLGYRKDKGPWWTSKEKGNVLRL